MKLNSCSYGYFKVSVQWKCKAPVAYFYHFDCRYEIMMCVAYDILYCDNLGYGKWIIGLGDIKKIRKNRALMA